MLDGEIVGLQCVTPSGQPGIGIFVHTEPL